MKTKSPSPARLVDPRVDPQVVRASRVEVVGVHGVASPRRRHRKGPDARHHVAEGLARAQLLDEAGVLLLEAGVPVDVAEVEAEGGAVLLHLALV